MRVEELLFNKECLKSTFSCLDDYGEWTSDDIIQRTKNLKKKLEKNKLNELEKVIVMCENSSLFIVATFAVLAAGGVVIPVDIKMPTAKLEEIIKDMNIRILCIFGNKIEFDRSKLIKNNIIILDLNKIDFNQDDPIGRYIVEYKKNKHDPAFILLTSGTSNKNKYVMLSHEAIVNNLNSIIDYMQPNNNDVFYITKTMIHSSTLVGEILVALQVGAKLIARNQVIPTGVMLRQISQYKTTILCVNPTILRLMSKAYKENIDLSTIKLIYTSGAIADEYLLKESEKMFHNINVLNMYGLTEAGPRVTAQRNYCKYKYGSVGYPVLGVNIYIKNDDFEDCNFDVVGNVYVSSNSLMIGYLNEDANNKIKNGLLKTGDLGYLDDEGELFIVGRSDDIILNGAHNINPNIIENIIKKLDNLIECLIFGVQDQLYGSKIICVIKNDKYLDYSGKDIFEHCTKYLELYECPNEILFWDDIPKTNSGKNSRNLASKKYNEFITNFN